MWRRKDYLRGLKKAFHNQMADAKSDTGRQMTKAEQVNAAIRFVDEEVIYKNDLAERPIDLASALRTDAVPQMYRRFIITVLHNLVEKGSDNLLPKHLQRRAPTKSSSSSSKKASSASAAGEEADEEEEDDDDELEEGEHANTEPGSPPAEDEEEEAEEQHTAKPARTPNAKKRSRAATAAATAASASEAHHGASFWKRAKR